MARLIDCEQYKLKYSGKDFTIQNMKVYWKDGSISDGSNKKNIVYIPQTYLNSLSDNQEEKTEIDEIIQDIILQDEDIKKELMSNKRHRQCHEKARNIAPSIRGSKIVTGYVTIGDRKVLHSIIEYDVDNKTVVIDWTSNLHITKEQYVELTKFVELSSFEGRKVIDDIELITENFNIGIKPYVVFREEIMRDIKKNSQIFQPTEAGMKKTECFRKEEQLEEDEENLR